MITKFYKNRKSILQQKNILYNSAFFGLQLRDVHNDIG